MMGFNGSGKLHKALTAAGLGVMLLASACRPADVAGDDIVITVDDYARAEITIGEVTTRSLADAVDAGDFFDDWQPDDEWENGRAAWQTTLVPYFDDAFADEVEDILVACDTGPCDFLFEDWDIVGANFRSGSHDGPAAPHVLDALRGIHNANAGGSGGFCLHFVIDKSTDMADSQWGAHHWVLEDGIFKNPVFKVEALNHWDQRCGEGNPVR